VGIVFATESEAGGRSNSRRRAWRLAALLLLAGTAIPIQASGATELTDAADAAQHVADEPRGQDIIVIAPPLFRDITPEAELDEDGIASYGLSTIDELLAEIQGELGEGDEPLILVNGEPVSDLQDIGAFPVEALRNVQILPRGSAVRAGGRTGQRVVSLTLQRRLRAATVTAAPRFSTEGNWSAGRGETLLTYLQGSTRANLGLRFRGESSLLESERDIIQPDPRRPFAIGGNIVPFPDSSGEIDPALSALAGQPVTVVPFPAGSSPSLADFAAFANQANATDLGEFRTLRPRLRNYDLNGTFATRLAPWLTSNSTLRLNRNVSRALRGLPSALFALSPDNGASPFSTDVGLAFYGQGPLQSRSVRESGEARVTLNGRFGRWKSNFNARYAGSKSTFDTERQSTLGNILLDDEISPFASDLSNLIAIQTDRSTARSRDGLVLFSLTGPAVALPAGDLTATLEGRLARSSFHSRSVFSGSDINRRFRRNEETVRGAVDIPLTSAGAGILSGIGDLSANAEVGVAHFSDAGTLDRYGLGLTWEPRPFLRMRGSIERTERPASMHVLGNPVLETPDVRMFDPLTGRTVDVLQITGGNPDIDPERLHVRRLSALVRPISSFDVQVNAEYTDTAARNFIASLPPASLPVMLAFPDRFVRDSNGELTTVDLRPVNFDSHREKRLRWGLNMRRKIGAATILGLPAVADAPESESGEETGAPPETGAKPRGSRGRPATYVQLGANHTVVFSDEIRIRPGLDPVDLLEGGALGIASGRVRHQADGTAAITSGGLGARLGVTWRGKSTLDTRIGDVEDTLTFSPLLALNLRAFADARRLFPNAIWARGTRASINLVNLTSQRQRVRDSFGNTPLQYQPGYRDPLGRTVEFEIRKVF
jgi:iron complex outermembrane recepter protein